MGMRGSTMATAGGSETTRDTGRARLRAVRLGSAAALVVMALAALACGGDQRTGLTVPQVATTAASQTVSTTEPGAPSEQDPAVTTTSQGGQSVVLPAPVTQTRDSILSAARAFDYESLAGLLDPATFSYSFGEGGDPTGYWQRLEEQGEVPILGDFLGVVLSMQAGRQDGVYVWPAVFAKAPSEWTADDLADMRTLYTEEEISGFKQAGGYLGYRVGILEDGTWIFFVTGD